MLYTVTKLSENTTTFMKKVSAGNDSIDQKMVPKLTGRQDFQKTVENFPPYFLYFSCHSMASKIVFQADAIQDSILETISNNLQHIIHRFPAQIPQAIAGQDIQQNQHFTSSIQQPFYPHCITFKQPIYQQ